MNKVAASRVLLATLRLVTTAFVVLSGLAAASWYSSAHLPYNSEGRYFDEVQGVIYLEQDVAAWGLITLAFGAMAMLSAFGTRKIHAPQPDSIRPFHEPNLPPS